MNFLITGVQGSGKGTHASNLAKQLGIYHISFGDTIKQCFVDDPAFVLPYTLERYNRGELAEDTVLFNVANRFLPELEQRYGGFILDGFPRTQGQMQFVMNNYKIDKCIKLIIPRSIAEDRMRSRGRSDDSEEGIKKRLDQYYNVTEPCFDIFKGTDKLIEIDSTGTKENTFNLILSKLT